MQFNSIQFIIFFVFVIVLYFSISHKYRWILLLFSSYYFYMCWKPEYIFLILFSTIIDYYCGLKMEDSKNNAQKKLFLTLSLLTNLSVLFGSFTTVIISYGSIGGGLISIFYGGFLSTFLIYLLLEFILRIKFSLD